MRPTVLPQASADPLDRHQRRREQNIPTLSVLCGPVGLAIRRWRSWAAGQGAPVVTTSNTDVHELLAAWLQALSRHRDLTVGAAGWLARVCGEPTDKLWPRLNSVTGHDRDWFWSGITVPAEKSGSAAVCRVLLDEGADRILRAVETGQIAGGSQLFQSLAELSGGGMLPAVLLTPGSAAAGVWLAEAARVAADLIAATPALPVAIAAESREVEQLLRPDPLPHALAMFREGVVPVHRLGAAELAESLGAAAATPGAQASTQRLVEDGVSEELAATYAEAVRRLGTRSSAEDEEAARSAAEAFLFERLESLAATAGLFALNQRLEFRHGPAPAEVDLLARSLRVVIELDGSYYHLNDLAAYRRDRRKDWELQRRGYLVLRFLSEDVVERLEEILDTILAAVELRRLSPTE